MSNRVTDPANRKPEDGPALATPHEELSVGSVRDRFEDLRRRLDAPVTDGERAPLREDLVGLVQDVDASIEALRELRDAMKPLADRYREKYLRPAPESAKVVDHLGASTFRERGWSALAAAAYEEATAHFEAALERDPRELSAMAMLAWAHLRQGRTGAADDVLARVQAIDSRHPLGRTIHGLAHLGADRPEQAIDLLRTVAEDDRMADRTARMYAHLYLGVALTRVGRPAEGRESIGRAIELGPNLTEAFWELGRLHAAAGERELALDAWRTGAENRFSGWGERCRAEVERAEQADDAGGGTRTETEDGGQGSQCLGGDFGAS